MSFDALFDYYVMTSSCINQALRVFEIYIAEPRQATRLLGSRYEITAFSQTWLSLNTDTNNTPVVPLSSAAQAALMSALAWNQTTSLRVWCLFFQCLTLNCNTKIDHPVRR